MSGDPQDQKDPRDHDWRAERAKPTENSRRVWNWSWQAQRKAQDETGFFCAAGRTILQSLSGDSFYQWRAFSSSANSSFPLCALLFSLLCPPRYLDDVSLKTFCVPAADSWNTRAPSSSLARSHGLSLPIHSHCLQPSLGPPALPPFPFLSRSPTHGVRGWSSRLLLPSLPPSHPLCLGGWGWERSCQARVLTLGTGAAMGETEREQLN